MRPSSTAIVVLIGAAFAFIGCSETASPTRPESVPSTGASSTASPLVAPAAAPRQVPFKGRFEGEDAHDATLGPGATTVVISTTATGVGTLVGRFSLSREVTADLVSFSATGFAQWIAANRDTIHTTVTGQAELSDLPGGYLKVTETHTITAGTGRFTGAQGSFTVVLFHKLEPREVAGGIARHDIFGSFEGTITSPGAAE